ncbi:hypothetical protein [Nocardia wallacei]|uniref:hypothetical protein n=1 Tax=Nocardia wallacei TaxID=480035 RepID=UPI002457F0DE|nr:hypothetical protein [Nocardia wallacei]
MLIALGVALWQVSKAKQDRKLQETQMTEDRQRYDTQMAALQRAEDDRIAAQARKVVPTLVRAEVFGPDMWSVKVANHSNAVVTELDVSVVAVDAEGQLIANGCQQANGKLGTSEAFRRVIADAISGAVDASMQRVAVPLHGIGNFAGVGLGGLGALAGQQMAPQVSQALQEQLTGQMTTEWPTTLTPEQFAVMAYSAVDEAVTLRVTITFTDEAGYRWARRDNSAPERIDEAS